MTKQSQQYYVYLITNKVNSVIYTGITSNLIKRIYEHKNKLIDGFTSRYNINKLVYFEEYNDVNLAIAREKQIKSGSRQNKVSLIDNSNPNWKDLYEELI